MPAMHTAHRIGVNRKRQVLMHTAFAPPDSLRIRVVALERLYTFDLSQPPPGFAQLLNVNERRSPAIRPLIFLCSPATQMMRAAHNPRPDSLSHPYSQHEVADVGRHSRE